MPKAVHHGKNLKSLILCCPLPPTSHRRKRKRLRIERQGISELGMSSGIGDALFTLLEKEIGSRGIRDAMIYFDHRGL